MAKIHGPFLSGWASGSIAGWLVCRPMKDGFCFHKKGIKTIPATDKQIEARFRFSRHQKKLKLLLALDYHYFIIGWEYWGDDFKALVEGCFLFVKALLKSLVSSCAPSGVAPRSIWDYYYKHSGKTYGQLMDRYIDRMRKHKVALKVYAHIYDEVKWDKL